MELKNTLRFGGEPVHPFHHPLTRWARISRDGVSLLIFVVSLQKKTGYYADGWERWERSVGFGAVGGGDGVYKMGRWYEHYKTLLSLRLQVLYVLRKGLYTPRILLWGWYWNPQSYSRNGYGFLVYRYIHNLANLRQGLPILQLVWTFDTQSGVVISEFFTWYEQKHIFPSEFLDQWYLHLMFISEICFHVTLPKTNISTWK